MGKNGDVIENLNEGDVVVRQNFKVEGALNLSTGNQVNEISDNVHFQKIVMEFCLPSVR
ncbi:hypothetical protein Q2T40_04575 [Winogradskyella maritima]|nr:hypothetical protein [Winogradskyella maritima]